MGNEKEEKKSLENSVKIYFRILSLLLIRTQNMEEVSSKLPLKNLLIKVVLILSKHPRFLSTLSVLTMRQNLCQMLTTQKEHWLIGLPQEAHCP